MKVPRLEPIAPRVWLLRGGLTKLMNVYLISMTGRATTAHVPHEAYNQDTGQARESIRRLAALRPRIVGVGHLGPMTGPDVVAELEAAARG